MDALRIALLNDREATALDSVPPSVLDCFERLKRATIRIGGDDQVAGPLRADFHTGRQVADVDLAVGGARDLVGVTGLCSRPVDRLIQLRGQNSETPWAVGDGTRGRGSGGPPRTRGG
jgi:hypothetical protein